MKVTMWEIDIVYITRDGFDYYISFSDTESICRMKVKNKRFLKEIFNQWVSGGKIMINGDDQIILIKENNENN